MRKNISYILFFIGLGLLMFLSDLWYSNLFNMDMWKYLFLLLILVSFTVILDLIEEKSFDIYCLCFLVLVGSIILIISDNLLLIYLGLELQTFSVFILIAKNRVSIKGSEAGLKYFMLGALSSGFYLLGLVVLFLSGYSFDLNDIYTLCLTEESIVLLSFTLIIISFCFKLSLFPFHFWIPDIYEGSSWDIIALISTLPKISVLSIIIQVLLNINLVLTFCLFSIAIGTIGALNQTKLKRLLAYSGIGHMGFIVLSYNIFNSSGYITGGTYLLIYMLTMISILILIINRNFKNEFIIELSNIKFINKLLAISLALLILSVAGMPPLSGFISKWYLIWMSIDNNYLISSSIIIIFSAIGAGYYLRLVKIIYFQKKSSYLLWKRILSVEERSDEFSTFFLGLLIFFTLFLIFNFSLIINMISFLFIKFY